MKNDVCDEINNKSQCNFDGGDCSQCVVNYVLDGYCDDINNNEECGFDGGDCCSSERDLTFCDHCLCYKNASKNPIQLVDSFSIGIQKLMHTILNL